MKPNKRFIASVTQTAKSSTPPLPFQRGARRTAFIAKRNKGEAQAKSA